MYTEKNYETTYIPHHLFFSISEKYCTKFQATRSSRITLFFTGYGTSTLNLNIQDLPLPIEQLIHYLKLAHAKV